MALKPIGVMACILWTFAVCASAQEGIPLVTKVEPPSWWAQHSVNPVRLLVRGKNLTGGRVRATQRAIQTSDAFINRNGTYLFVNVNISQTARLDLITNLETAQGNTTIPFTIEQPLDTKTHFQSITADDVIYLIMPDRFANGDTTNDVRKTLHLPLMIGKIHAPITVAICGRNQSSFLLEGAWCHRPVAYSVVRQLERHQSMR